MIRKLCLAECDPRHRERTQREPYAIADVDFIRAGAAARLPEQPGRLGRPVAETAPVRSVVAAGGGKEGAVAHRVPAVGLPEQRPDERCLVDRMRNRPPHEPVAQSRVTRSPDAEREMLPLGPRNGLHPNPRQLPQLPSLAGREREAVDDVQLVPPQPLDRLPVLFPEPEHEPVEIRRPRPPVARVAHERDLTAGNPTPDEEGAASDRASGPRVVNPLVPHGAEVRAGKRMRREHEREQAAPVRVARAQHHPHGPGVERANAGDLGQSRRVDRV